MTVESGPDIITNNLVLSFDAANERSFRGNPTTNLVSSATAMSSWTAYYRTTAAPTFTTEFGTTGYRFVNQPSWNGVYRNFNLGSAGTYTFSAWFRFWGGSANNNGATVYVSNYGGGDTVVGLDKSRIGEWQRVSHTVSVTSPSNVYFYLISYGGTDNGTGNPDWSSWDVTMPQIEAGSTLTPFVDGTRGTTVATGGGWRNLIPTGNTTGGELVNGPTFNSDNSGNLSFDGTNDYVNFSAGTLGGTATVEMWVKLGAGYAGRMFFGWLYYDVWCPSGHLGYNTGNGDCYGITSTVVSNLGLVGNWKHYVFEMRSDVAYTNNKIYINGVEQSIGQVQSSEASGNRNFNSGNGRISSWLGTVDYIIPMNCSIFSVYNGSLTATQVLQNFNATRRRFGV